MARLKPRQEFESRPSVTSRVPEETRLDFDESLLPEDSWEPDHESGEYEVTGYQTRGIENYLEEGEFGYLVEWKAMSSQIGSASRT